MNDSDSLSKCDSTFYHLNIICGISCELDFFWLGSVIIRKVVSANCNFSKNHVFWKLKNNLLQYLFSYHKQGMQNMPASALTVVGPCRCMWLHWLVASHHGMGVVAQYYYVPCFEVLACFSTGRWRLFKMNCWLT